MRHPTDSEHVQHFGAGFSLRECVRAEVLQCWQVWFEGSIESFHYSRQAALVHGQQQAAARQALMPGMVRRKAQP